MKHHITNTFRKMVNHISSSRYGLVLLTGGFAFLLWTAVRLCLLIYSWNEASPNVIELNAIFFTGFLFDFTFFIFATLLPCLYIALTPKFLWKTLANKFFVSVALCMTFFIMLFGATAEFFFWEEFGVRFNFISVDYLIYRREVVDNIIESYPVFTILPVLGVIAAFFVYKTSPMWNKALQADDSVKKRLSYLGAIGLLAGCMFLMPTSSARNIFENSYQRELASNGPYQFVNAFKNNSLDYYQFYQTLPEDIVTQKVRSNLSNPAATFASDNPHDLTRWIAAEGSEKRYNVVLVTIESLSPKYLTLYGNSRNITPNLDALTDKSVFYSNLYATGTRTTRGLEALTLSIPPTPGRSIVKRIGQESGFLALGNVLKAKGYQNYFVYGGRGYFDNMNAFFSGNGYSTIDQSSVPDDEIGFENAWGMADEYLYAQAIKTADAASTNKAPFFLHVLTTSNHRPYTYPDGRVEIPSGDGRSGAVQYTDWAIGDFLKKASKASWFKNTIFVFIADHQASSAGRANLPLERYQIPMWIYAPNLIAPGQVDTLASQIDVAPTILGLLNMSYPSFFYGRDIAKTDPSEGRAFIGNYQYLGLYKGDTLAVLGPKKSMELNGIKNGKVVWTSKATVENPLIQECISYYQSASYVFKNKINSVRKLSLFKKQL